MTIEITRPEVEDLINQRLRSGTFRDAQDVILQAHESSSAPATASPGSPVTRYEAKNMVEPFAPVRRLNLTFERDRDTGRDIEL